MAGANTTVLSEQWKLSGRADEWNVLGRKSPSPPFEKGSEAGGDCISDIARYEERTEGSEKNQRGIL